MSNMIELMKILFDIPLKFINDFTIIVARESYNIINTLLDSPITIIILLFIIISSYYTKEFSFSILGFNLGYNKRITKTKIIYKTIESKSDTIVKEKTTEEIKQEIKESKEDIKIKIKKCIACKDIIELNEIFCINCGTKQI